MSLITEQSLKAIPGILTSSLSNLGSVVTSLTNLKQTSPQQFQQFTSEITSLLKGFDSGSNINNIVGGLTETATQLSSTDLAPSTISGLAESVQTAGLAIDKQTPSNQQSVNIQTSRASVEQVSQTNSKSFAADIWPPNLGKYWFMMAFRPYHFSSRVFGGGYQPIQGPLAGATVFPLPNNLTDTLQVAFSDFSPGAEYAGAIGAAVGGLVGGLGSALVTKLAGKLAGLGPGVNDALGGMVGGVNGALTATTKVGMAAAGIAINPATTLLLQGPLLKEHTFQWSLSPNNEADSKSLQKIINRIKRDMSPGLAAGGLLLTYPMMINCYIYNEDQLYAFKPAMITALSVNYSPAGNPAFYKSKFPVEVQIAMQIKELEAWLREDYLLNEVSR